MTYTSILFVVGISLGFAMLICHFTRDDDTDFFGIVGGLLIIVSIVSMFMSSLFATAQVESSNDVDTNRQLLQEKRSTGSSTKTDICFTKGSKEEYYHLLQEKVAIESILNSKDKTDLPALINRINEYNNSVTTAKIGSTDPTFGDFYSKDVEWQALELIELE